LGVTSYPYPCPYCRTPADLTTGCPGCGRGPDPDAAEVVRLDAEIPVLTAKLAAAREAVSAADAALRHAWQSREAAAARVRAAMAAASFVAAPGPPAAPVGSGPVGSGPVGLGAVGSGPVGSGPVGSGPVAAGRAPRSKEASTRLVQNALFLLGGVLLAVAAIVFTAVAWSQFGVGGRALLLAGFTVAALAVPPAALRRGLSATAETFAAVGLLLVLLDGYAAWYVNLFGVADYSALGYAGAVCAVTAAVAAGYEHVTGLTGPRFAALLVAQPVLPLLAAPFDPDLTGWAYTLTAVTVLNLAVIQLRRSALSPLGIAAYLLGGLAALLSGITALLAIVVAGTPVEAALAGSALVAVALVVLAASIMVRITIAREVSGALLVVALAIAAGRFAAVAGGDFLAPVLAAAVVSALAAVVAVLPVTVRRGPRIGALTVVVAFALPIVAEAVGAAATGTADWRLPAVIVLLTAALTGLVPRALQPHVVLGGIALLAVAAPAGFGLLWWTAPILNLVVVAMALALALRRLPVWPVSVAVVLTTHALVVAFEQPNVAAATLAAVAVLGTTTAVAARSGALGGVALAAGLLAVPASAWSAAQALGLAERPQTRITLAVAALLVGALHVISRRWPAYRSYALGAALLAVVTAPAWALASGDSPAIYAAATLLLSAATLPALARRTTTEARALGATATVAGIALLVAVARSVFLVFVAPYAWLSRVWTGRPDGVGLAPGSTGRVATGDVVALAVFAAAVALAAYALSGRRAAIWAVVPPLAVTAPLALATAGVPWPGVPVASLLIGLAGLLSAALRTRSSGTGGLGAAGTGAFSRRVATPVVSGALVGAGLAGALPTHGMSLAALGATLVAGAVAGVLGGTLPARLGGWLSVVGSGLGLSFTAARAAELPLPTTAFAVLGAAAAALALGSALSARGSTEGPPGLGGVAVGGAAAVGAARGRGAEGRAAAGRAGEGPAVQVAAHAGAFVALLLATGSIRHAAAVCTFWGLALGVRALWPGQAAKVRRGHLVAAAAAELGGWWLLIAGEKVATVEAYTLPAAAVALLAGWLARRSRDELSSWAAYGPALAAALLPSLASVLVGEGQPVRRLLLGLGALAVVLAGAQARLRAPVIAGGVVLALTALHEIVLVWDLLPRWIPLAAAGLLLVGLAMTLERRRRDLARVRAALTRMS
jgi:hypothetical protein